jgi:hypothetical protein
MDEWIARLRHAVGNDLLILNSSGVWIENAAGEVLLQRRSPTEELWGFPWWDHESWGVRC